VGGHETIGQILIEHEADTNETFSAQDLHQRHRLEVRDRLQLAVQAGKMAIVEIVAGAERT